AAPKPNVPPLATPVVVSILMTPDCVKVAASSVMLPVPAVPVLEFMLPRMMPVCADALASAAIMVSLPFIIAGAAGDYVGAADYTTRVKSCSVIGYYGDIAAFASGSMSVDSCDAGEINVSPSWTGRTD